MASKQLMRRIVDEERSNRLIPIDIANVNPAVARNNTGKSEKRRLAALKTWEKRRMKQNNAAALEQASIVTSNDHTMKDASNVSEEDTSSPNASLSNTAPDKVNKRRLAALKTWEKRRAKQGIAPTNPASIVPPIEDENNTSSIQDRHVDSTKNPDGITSSPYEGNVNKRSLAALKMWEKRRKMKAATSTKPAVITSSNEYASNAASSEGEDNDLANAHTTTNGYVRKHKNGYTAEMRSQAAKAAWEKRKRQKIGIKSTPHDVTDTSEEDSAASKQVQPKPMKQKRWHDPKAKRSRPRRSPQEVDGIDEAAKDQNQVITLLKHSRGWMEFHPSSRYGNACADYAYIPGSLAQLIRNGAFSKPIVMELGTLGIHYALDYEGYGGLKEMIDTFGEDYSPCPSEEMMEASRELQEKKDSKIEYWDLGEDLPWKEVEDMMDEHINERIDKQLAERREELQAEVDVEQFSSPLDDIPEVANILASLHDIDCSEKKAVDEESNEKCPTATEDNIALESASSSHIRPSTDSDKHSYSPALKALCGYESESSDDDSDDSVPSTLSIEVTKPQIYNDKCNGIEFNKPTDNTTIVEEAADVGSSDGRVDGSCGTHLYYNSYHQESEDYNMFGVPLYNPSQSATAPILSSDHNHNSIIPPHLEQMRNIQSSEACVHESSEGTLFSQDNRNVMLFAPTSSLE